MHSWVPVWESFGHGTGLLYVTVLLAGEFHLLLWHFFEGFSVSPEELVHGVPLPGKVAHELVEPLRVTLCGLLEL